MSQLARVFRRNRFPAQEALKKAQKARRWLKLLPRGFDIADKGQNGSYDLAVTPEAERVPIGIDQVRQGTELLPLLFIVRLLEPPRVRALAGSFQLHDPCQCAMNADREIG